ncbi:MAG: PaaI family thioesterase [Actinomycetota bacterium]
MSEQRKNMDRWLGNGGMAIIDAVGGTISSYGVDGEDLGWAEGSLKATELACNPHGTVQGGVHAILLDAIINFAINAALVGKDRTKATIEMKTEFMRAASRDQEYLLRGEVTRLGRQVAYGESTLSTLDGAIVSRATATFLLHREGQ